MPYTTEPFHVTESELAEIRALIIDSYAGEKRPRTWRLGAFENWYYTSRFHEPPEYFTKRCQLWRDETGRLVGCLFSYYAIIFTQALPGHPGLYNDMLAWAEQNWAVEGELAVSGWEWDEVRNAVLRARGYVDEKIQSYLRVYDVRKPRAPARLPEGFSFNTYAGHPDAQARVGIEKAVWDNPFLDLSWLEAKSTAPDYQWDWDLLILSPQKQVVGFSLVWVDWANRLAEIEPLGVHPEFRRMGLARALVAETLSRLRERGVDTLYIQSDPDPNYAANLLYQSFDPVEVYREHLWRKRVNELLS